MRCAGPRGREQVLGPGGAAPGRGPAGAGRAEALLFFLSRAKRKQSGQRRVPAVSARLSSLSRRSLASRAFTPTGKRSPRLLLGAAGEGRGTLVPGLGSCASPVCALCLGVPPQACEPGLGRPRNLPLCAVPEGRAWLSCSGAADPAKLDQGLGTRQPGWRGPSCAPAQWWDQVCPGWTTHSPGPTRPSWHR